MYDSLKHCLPDNLRKNIFAAFLLGWAVAIGAGLIYYPVDIVCRRMMMISGAAAIYVSSLRAFRDDVAKEGTKLLFKGAGANIIRAIPGAGVLSGYAIFRRGSVAKIPSFLSPTTDNLFFPA